jgi:2-haloacid dehalogenase/putative hydrolase of the HAD superfamily
MKLTDFKVLTFDCYGTLIDWETGVLAALRPWLDREGADVSDAQLLELFAHFEPHQQAATPTMLYRELLGRVQQRIAQHLGVETTEEDARAFGSSIKDWPAFSDSPDALAYLKQHYKLVVLSNVDRESFKASNKRLGVEFDAIFTAQDIGSYKPHPANFEYLVRELKIRGFEKGDILHTAESLYHDHVPAKRIGLATCWVDREHRAGAGATRAPPEPVTTDFRVRTLAELVAQHHACV